MFQNINNVRDNHSLALSISKLIITDEHYPAFAVRTCNEHYFMGDRCKNSIGYEGTCGSYIDATNSDVEDIERILKMHKNYNEVTGNPRMCYLGHYTYLIGGTIMGADNDPYGVVLKNAEVIAIIKKDEDKAVSNENIQAKSFLKNGTPVFQY